MPLVAVLFAVVLAFPFGTAEATAVSATGGLTVEISVEVLEPASAVLVRGVGLVDELPPVSLVDQGDGTWAGVIEMPVVDDILVGFELVPIGGGVSTISGLYRLSALGVDPAVFEAGKIVPPIIVAERSSGPPAWLWLALAAGAAAVAFVLLWMWARSARSDSDSEPAGASPDA